MGRWRVDFAPRSITATARPCEGRRSRSIKMAAGGLSRNWPIRPLVFGTDASTVKPDFFKARACWRAASGSQQTRRIWGMQMNLADRAGVALPGGRGSVWDLLRSNRTCVTLVLESNRRIVADKTDVWQGTL